MVSSPSKASELIPLPSQVLQWPRAHLREPHHPAPRPVQEQTGLSASRLPSGGDRPRVLQLRLQERLPTRLYPRKIGFRGGTSVQRALSDARRPEGPRLGPQHLDAADRRPGLPLLAGPHPDRARADPCEADHHGSDQSSRGPVAREPRGHCLRP